MSGGSSWCCVRVRARLVFEVRAAIARFGQPWSALPRDNVAWDVLFPARIVAT